MNELVIIYDRATYTLQTQLVNIVMHHNHSFRTFAQTPAGYVGLCSGCRVINVAFNNSLFCLSFEQYEAFCDMFTNRVLLQPFTTTHGKEWLLQTPTPNYFLAFSEEEVTQLKALLDEAAPILEAERILALVRTN